MVDMEGLPGEELVRKGIEDLARGILDSQEALLVAMARTKLRNLGLNISLQAFEIEEAELELYELLGHSHLNAYREYKALRNRLGKFERALQARVSRERQRATGIA